MAGHGRPRRVWTEEEDAMLRDMAADETSQAIAARVLGVGQSTVHNRARALGLTWKRSGAPGPRQVALGNRPKPTRPAPAGRRVAPTPQYPLDETRCRWFDCLGFCGRVMWTDSAHRVCAQCTARQAGAPERDSHRVLIEAAYNPQAW